MKKEIDIDLKKSFEGLGRLIIFSISIYEIATGIRRGIGSTALIGIIGFATWLLLVKIKELEEGIRDRDDIIIDYYMQLEKLKKERGEE